MKGDDRMQYQISGGNLPVVELSLNGGEAVFTESGGMSWMDKCFNMSTNMEGGLLKGIGRKMAGESMFLTTYTCEAQFGRIAFASSMPGNIIPLQLGPGQSLIAQKKAFLVAERSVQLEAFFRKKLGAGLFGGEGFVLNRITGPGMAFVEIDGSVVERDLAPGEAILVDTGCVGMFEPSVSMEVETVKGFKNVLFGGEGLFLTRLTGPGRVWLQSMPVSSLAKEIIPFMPTKN